MAGFFDGLRKKPNPVKARASTLRAIGGEEQSLWIDDNDPRISYHLRPRAKRITIKVDAAKRSIIVSVPGSAKKLAAAQSFVEEKYDWILVQLEALPRAQPFIDGEPFMLFGEAYTLFAPEGRARPSIDRSHLMVSVPSAPDTLPGRTKRFLVRTARAELENRTHMYAHRLGKPVDKISVRDTASRWGSCLIGNAKRGGQISYSWRLICAPPYVLDYVCAHECAHLVEANHGPDFWALCHELNDDVERAKKWLSKHGPSLHAVGAAQ